MTVQLEYINHMLQILKKLILISYYAGNMLNAFSHLYNDYYAQNYAIHKDKVLVLSKGLA